MKFAKLRFLVATEEFKDFEPIGASNDEDRPFDRTKSSRAVKGSQLHVLEIEHTLGNEAGLPFKEKQILVH